MNDDGTMARLPQLIKFARKHKLKICSIEDLIKYRRQRAFMEVVLFRSDIENGIVQ